MPKYRATKKMEQVKLEAQLREGRGKGAARATRRAGLVPAIVYGHKLEPTAVQLPERVIRRFLGTIGENAMINMELGQDKIETVMLKEVQIDPVTRQIVHVDFLRVSLEEQVTAHVPITLIGTAPGIAEGGIQEFLLREIQVECQAGQMPENIEIDVSALEIGDRIRVGDLPSLENISVLDDPVTIIVAVAIPTLREEEVVVEEEEELEDEEDREPEVIGEKGAGEDEDEEEDN